MKIESLHVGMRVRHRSYGIGVVKVITEHTAEIRFDDETRKIDPEISEVEPADPVASLSGVSVPLPQLIQETVDAAVKALGLDRPDDLVEQLGARWQKGTMVLRPADAALQAKEVPLETFFHKIVMMRNNFRVLEQKINGHPQLSDAEKVEMQQYISRCYGSMTTFNILFRNEAEAFKSKG